MLQSLRIRNLALLDSIDLDFAPGFTAVTGETGAGKSILLGALGLLSGARVDKTIIRQGAEACEVEGCLQFASPERMDTMLESLGLPACEEGQLLLKRVIPRDKPARITINGSLATLSNLQAVGELWIDFHGPGEPRRLLKAECQIELLDLFGQCGGLADEYRAAYDGWRAVLGEIERLGGETRLGADQIDFLRQQIARIDSVDLDPEAVEMLERDAVRQSRSLELTEISTLLAEGLTADDGGISPRLAPLVRAAHQLAGIDPSTQALAARLESLAIETEDLGQEFRAFAEGLEFDPERAADLQARMTVLLELRRKYGPALADIRQAREKLHRQIEEQGDIEGTLTRLRADAAQREAGCRTLASNLRRAREKAGRTLTERAAAILGELGFKKADLRIAFQPENALRPHGDARPEMLFAPNAGEPALPLARIASSGELARVMLGLKTVLAEVDDIPVLVFDEVDANIGGEIGRVVGEKMQAIARRHQVVCVTHLPQVAALGTSHLVVEKEQRGERVGVSIAPLHGDAGLRTGELARMLGDRHAKSALAHARELLGRG